MSSILIKNGTLATATDTCLADVYIVDEKVNTIGQNLQMQADLVIDATGKIVFPGGIDPHVHVDMPFMGTYSSDNYETGTRAALHGGMDCHGDHGGRPRPARISPPRSAPSAPAQHARRTADQR